MRRRLRVLLLTAILAAAAPAPSAAAQEAGPPADPMSLERVEELTRMGRTEEARVGLLGWWERDREGASRREVQRALWLRGILTVDPEQAALDFWRLVIEYPGGPFSDDALFRLAQSAHATGDGAAAQRWVEMLERDYPSSPLRREARQWLDAAGDPPAQPPVTGPEGAPSTEGRAAADTATADTVAAAGVEPSEGGAGRAGQPPRAAADSTDAPRYSVQLGAFSSIDRATALYRQARDAGLEARIVRVPDTNLFHVRVGHYDSAGAAGEPMRRITGMGFVAALVRDAHNEELVRR